MTERPILFSAGMVNAIRENRKTQTRRVIKPSHDGGVIAGPAAEPYGAVEGWGGGGWKEHSRTPPGMEVLMCPYGVPGDRLWVRETYGIGGARLVDPTINYRADGGQLPLNRVRGTDSVWQHSYTTHCVTGTKLLEVPEGWRPSIFMFRWASRILLEITDVRAERVQEISGDDVVAEGCLLAWGSRQTLGTDEESARRNLYTQLWDSINGTPHGKRPAYPWRDNPFVWVISFKVVTDGQMG
jgi:hypothetical protein